MAGEGFWKRLGAWLKYDVFGLEEPVHSEPGPPEEQLREDAVCRRRDILAAIGRARPLDQIPPGSMGIAFSGGGIRSATLSLGVAQALARQDRLLDFDYCSTVSGGGYFGSFLGSLFLPETARGPVARPGDASVSEAQAKAHFADQALKAKVRETMIKYQGPDGSYVARNPLWWLREHSRYLAPNGTSDYLPAATYMIRNWAALVYVFALPVALASLVLIMSGYALLSGTLPGWIADPARIYSVLELGKETVAAKVSCGCPMDATSPVSWYVSPLVFLAALCLFLTLAASVSYWLSEYMSLGASKLRRRMDGLRGGLVEPFLQGLFSRRSRFLASLALTTGAAGITGWFAYRFVPAAVPVLFGTPLPEWSFLGAFSVFSLSLVLTAVVFALYAHFRSISFSHEAFTAEVRRRLTHTNAIWLGITLVVVTGTIIDTLALHLYAWLIAKGSPAGVFSGVSALVIPASAWIINKLPGWARDGEGKVARFLSKQIWNIALVFGVAMFGLLSIITHVGMQFLLFGGASWLEVTPPAIATPILWFVSGSFVALFLLTGWSTGFINLSSLHAIYASRLTRAYLGATNLERLQKSADENRKTSIRDSDPRDQIPIDAYAQSRSAAPIHLINVTLNETKSQAKSQLLERDRKGVPLVFAPEGVLVDAGRDVSAQSYFSWDTVRDFGVEALSVGQLCAISGAAASSAMGARTTLGGALAMTFANIRLGYWWAVGDMIRGRVTLTGKPKTWLYYRLTRPFRTYFYLWNEMTANYSRTHGRLNISDGGHFENSGAYELLRRRVRTIVVCDNGADPNYEFNDLEMLIRKARIDLGMSINVASAAHVHRALGKRGAQLFLNGGDAEWRERLPRADAKSVASSDERAFCLLLAVYEDSDGDGRAEFVGYIVWMKPRLFCGAPQDVVGYSLAHPDFPQQTTGDQFFDEAQWESYRALGEVMMRELLGGTLWKENVLRHLNQFAGRP